MSRGPVLVLIISSIISCGEVRSFLSSSCSASSHWCPLFSSGAAIVRRTKSVASHQSLRLVLIELGKTARNMISRSSSSDVLGLLVPRLALPSRGASRALFVIVMVARGKGRVLRFCSCRLIGGEASFVCPAAWRRACPSSFAYRLVLLLVVSSRLAVSSLVSGSGEALSSGFIPAGADGRRFSSRPSRGWAGACLS